MIYELAPFARANFKETCLLLIMMFVQRLQENLHG